MKKGDINMLDRSQMETIKRGDIFWVDFGDANVVGCEQSKTRPCICVGNDIGNKFSPVVIVAVITSQINKAKMPTHVQVGVDCGLDKDSIILLEQIKTVDKRRITSTIGKASQEVLDRVDRAIEISLTVGNAKHSVMNNQEKGATCKANLVYNSESVLREMIQENESFILIDKYTQKRMKRLNELESYCKINNLDYRRFYTTVTDTRRVQSK